MDTEWFLLGNGSRHDVTIVRLLLLHMHVNGVSIDFFCLKMKKEKKKNEGEEKCLWGEVKRKKKPNRGHVFRRRSSSLPSTYLPRRHLPRTRLHTDPAAIFQYVARELDGFSRCWVYSGHLQMFSYCD